MKLINLIALSSSITLLVACGSSPVMVTYDASKSSNIDHLPLPADAPALVELTKVEVPRLTVEVVAEDDSLSRAPLLVEEVVNSLGQKSLKLNRGISTSWELVEQALTEQGIETKDRNRSEYRFELGSNAKKGFLKRLFSKKAKALSLVLIPNGQFTILSLEADDDALPEAGEVDRVLSALLEHWAE